MKFKKWFENWDITGLRIKTPILEMDWSPQEADKNAAWDNLMLNCFHIDCMLQS